MSTDHNYKHLQALKSLILLNDRELLNIQLEKFKNIDNSLHDEICKLISEDRISDCIDTLNTKISSLSGIISYEDIEFKQLQEECKILEDQVVELEANKIEILSIINKFQYQYHLIVGSFDG
jgi:hypothetical protein